MDQTRSVIIGVMDLITNKKGNRLLAHNGYVYKLNKTAKHSYWKCIRNNEEKCLGRLTVHGNKVILKNIHNHLQETAPPITDHSATSQVYVKEEIISDSETFNSFTDEFQDDALNLTSTCSHMPINSLASSSSAVALPVSTRASTPESTTHEVHRGKKRRGREIPNESSSSGTGLVKQEADNIGTFCSYVQAELMKMPEPDAEELLEEMLLVLVNKKKIIRGRLQK